MHFTPTYSSWINQVERWFALITARAIRRNSFTSVRELKQQIELFVQRHNADTTPFKWVATADSILQKVETIAKRISATGHLVAQLRDATSLFGVEPARVAW
jgi:putative transposase